MFEAATKRTILFRAAVFKLREWVSNFTVLSTNINHDKTGSNTLDDKGENVLGMRWKVVEDTLLFNIREVTSHPLPTKRDILSRVC